MNNNAQIETLFKELKITQQNLKATTDPKEIERLESHHEELRANIEELSSSCEIDYEHMGKTMLFRATANALMHRICHRQELHTIIQELKAIGIPRDVMTADKETLKRYLQQIEHPNPSKYERYHEFIRTIESKSYRENPTKKQELLKDFVWLINKDSLGSQLMDAFQIDNSIFRKILGDNNDFESLVDRWHQLNSI